MTLTLLMLLGFGLLPLGAVVLARYLDALAWRGSLVAFRLHLPSNLTVDDAVRWLSSIAASTHPPRFSLLPLPPVALEVVATNSGIAHYVLVNTSSRAKLLGSVRANMPGARLEAADDYLVSPHRATLAGEFTMTSRSRPLAYDRAEAVSSSLLASLQPLGPSERITVQLIITSAGTPMPVPSKSHNGSSVPWWLEAQAPDDADAIRAQRVKQRDQAFSAALRLGVNAKSRQRAYGLLSRSWGTVHGLNAPGVRLVRRFLPSFLVTGRLSKRSYPVFWWPLLLNTRETIGLTAFPFGVHLPGMSLGRSRQLPPSPSLPSHGNIVGVSNYPGMTSRVLALKTEDRLRHVHLIGPTGVGKSTLLARMALQDIAAGYGTVVVDAKGDVVTDIVARIPKHRESDLVVLDPSEMKDSIIGFNPLAVARGNEHAQELIADDVLGIFHSIYRDFWGPRTDEILRAALFSLTHTRAPDGSAFTLIEVPELLTNPALRRYVTEQASMPAHLRSFWQWFDGSLSDGERVQAIGPVLNKLRAFSMRSSIRLMLGQSKGVKLDYKFCRKGILLVSLAKGKLGSETASLLGSLLVASLWQTMQTRINIPAEKRRPFFAYLDEFQDIVRLGSDNDLADMLAQARGLGLSLTLAHQYLSQLPETVKEAALGTVRTQIAFQLEWDDARALEPRFAPLTRDDLAGLSTYEVALRPCVNGQTLAPVTGMTLPLDEPTSDGQALAKASRERWGASRADIESGLLSRLSVTSSKPGGRFGRESSGGQI